jgi:adenylate cyclase
VSGTRRLAAITFIDVAGFTTLTQEDERGALALVGELEGLLAPVLKKFRGRRVKSTGDGVLLEFQNALDAVECSVEFQRRVHDRNDRAGARPLPVRVGVHLGDVQGRGADILGDAVNIASRVEGLAEVGGVTLSAPVYDQVHNKVSVGLARVGPRPLRGVREPMVLYRVILPWTRPSGPPLASAGPRLAVLPLANISPDPDDAYFADGLTEELVSVLSRIHGLRVVARSSVSQYKTSPKPVSLVGAELGVSSVLEGSVRKSGNRLRVSLQLVDVTSEEPTWSETYNRQLDDVFVVQSDIADRTAKALQLELTKGAAPRIVRRPTSDLAAYDLYLRGLVAQQEATPAAFEEAGRCFERATALDPSFAEAYAAWADMYVAAAGDTMPMPAVMPRARELARRAIELDPESSAAHSALGNIAYQFDHDWARAEAEFRTAIELNPSNLNAHRFYAMMLLSLRRLDEAREVTQAAIRLDPGGRHRMTLGVIDLAAGRYDSAIAVHEAERDRHPGAIGPRIFLGLCYVAAGRLDEARREADLPLDGADDTERFDHALLSALVGRPELARAVAAKAERGEAESYTSDTHLALLYSALGDRDRALSLLEKEWREGDRVLWLFYSGVWFDPIRADPRFTALLRKYGLPTDPPIRPATGDGPSPPPAEGGPRGSPRSRRPRRWPKHN